MAPPSGALPRTLTHLVNPSENHLGRLLGRVGFARVGRTLSHPYLTHAVFFRPGLASPSWGHHRSSSFPVPLSLSPFLALRLRFLSFSFSFPFSSSSTFSTSTRGVWVCGGGVLSFVLVQRR